LQSAYEGETGLIDIEHSNFIVIALDLTVEMAGHIDWWRVR